MPDGWHYCQMGSSQGLKKYCFLGSMIFGNESFLWHMSKIFPGLSSKFLHMSWLLTICPVLSGYVLNYCKIMAYNLFLLIFWIESVLGNRICLGSLIQCIHINSDPGSSIARWVAALPDGQQHYQIGGNIAR